MHIEGIHFGTTGYWSLSSPKQQDIKKKEEKREKKKNPLREAVQKLSLQDRSLQNGYSPRDSLFLLDWGVLWTGFPEVI
jgi:hypothetical protein